jgi:hypothetical protein
MTVPFVLGLAACAWLSAWRFVAEPEDLYEKLPETLILEEENVVQE